MIVLDTNVLSEVMKGSPHKTVYKWYRTVPRSNLFVTAVTEAEILAGIAVLPAGRRRTELTNRVLFTFQNSFSGRVFAFDSQSATHYADIVSKRRSLGQPINALDAQIAAIARDKAMVVATRNIRDFQNCGVDLIDPWVS